VIPYNAELKERSRELRDNMTNAEKFLWSFIRNKQLKGCWFYRQRPIGIYIVDFYCPKAKLVIEVDGGQHFSDDMIKYDKERDTYINSLGLTVLRFTNNEVLRKIDRVIKVIESKIE
jgi:very-short-patch-repair endonuclease